MAPIPDNTIDLKVPSGNLLNNYNTNGTNKKDHRFGKVILHDNNELQDIICRIGKKDKHKVPPSYGCSNTDTHR
ncbi:hypothetical protein [Staphylococcus phage vB_SauH_DELF3]|nr:hypothetical protein [Staphylococcus phage vB_SauH_DELF3]